LREVFLGLGTNLGDKETNLREACRFISEIPETSLLQKSEMLETAPWGVTDQPSFLNMVVELETNLNPYELLAVLLRIEEKMGRVRTKKWGPRIIDIDIIFYGSMVIHADNLNIPHLYLTERDFVLIPLNEIAPDFRHPVTGVTIKEYLKINKMEKL
jgi:2-amino-4-hydroxy-6-hydroxymethyldihydropteridine diphosphokinase